MVLCNTPIFLAFLDQLPMYVTQVSGGSQWGSCSLLIGTRGALRCGYDERKCAFQ